MMDRIILAIESSCDETSAAIIRNDEVSQQCNFITNNP